MADYRLSGYTTEASLSVPAITQLGRVESEDTGGISDSNWNDVRTGTGTSIATTGNSLVASSIGAGSTLQCNRSFISFPIPDNLSRLDNTPQLVLRCSSIIGSDNRFVPTSIDYTNFVNPWTSWATPLRQFTAAQISNSAKYIDGTYVEVPGTGEITATLNETAKAHILMGGASSNNVRYIILSLIEYDYDWTGTTPIVGRDHSMTFQDFSDANPPLLVLRKPWFVNDRGDEFPVDYDYTIRAFDVGVNQKDRSVPQLPFSTAIKGPMSLRGKNVPYKVTS